ncbi:aldo/keto reductase [Verrucomicrobiales bacterium]|nr:aldo/keto reductase [Verrucomicrobiales bacterium]MDC0292165.1 aldo/keto reductase [Verrucomicrobiales bacterium]
MQPTRTVFGTWSGGRYMHFGEMLSEADLEALAQQAYEDGIRTFLTADVYGTGKADEMLGRALKGIDRNSYSLVGMVGHDIYDGQRAGSKGYARFTHADLRSEDEYAEYLVTATEKSLERCQADRFDLVMLHNPDTVGYSNVKVWDGMKNLKTEGLADLTGIAPGPANGFTIDMAHCFEQYHEAIDWSMVILNPLEPWPTNNLLPIAKKYDIDLMTRVVDYGGMFHDDVKPGHHFKDGDHRTYRMAGWIERGSERIEQMRGIAEKYDLTMLQLACVWNLSQEPVKSVAPTFLQEAGEGARPVQEKVTEMAKVPDVTLTKEEIATIAEIGQNEGCMKLKGASTRNEGEPQPDTWPMRDELVPVAERWGLNPAW